MPTKRPRITVTETPELAHRLNLVAARLPERRRSRADLLIALTELAEGVIGEADQHGHGDDRKKAKAFILGYTAGVAVEQSEQMLDAREAEWTHELY